MKSLFYFCLLFVFLPHLVKAATISPAIIDLQLDPGQSHTYEMRLYNETKEDVFISGSIEKFVPKGETGEAKILPFDITDKSVNWVKLPNNSLFLKAGEEVTVPVMIDIPLTADIGGYYLAIMWESSSGPKSEASDQALISSRVGSLLLLEIKGETDIDLELVDFNIKGDKKFYTNASFDFFLRLRNPGNVHLRPQGSVVIKNFLGNTIEALPINFEQGAVLPKTTRAFNIPWNSDLRETGITPYFISQLSSFHLGLFSAKAIIDYGDNRSLESNLIYFWIIPWPWLTVIVVLLVAVICVFKLLKKKK